MCWAWAADVAPLPLLPAAAGAGVVLQPRAAGAALGAPAVWSNPAGAHHSSGRRAWGGSLSCTWLPACDCSFCCRLPCHSCLVPRPLGAAAVVPAQRSAPCPAVAEGTPHAPHRRGRKSEHAGGAAVMVGAFAAKVGPCARRSGRCGWGPAPGCRHAWIAACRGTGRHCSPPLFASLAPPTLGKKKAPLAEWRANPAHPLQAALLGALLATVHQFQLPRLALECIYSEQSSRAWGQVHALWSQRRMGVARRGRRSRGHAQWYGPLATNTMSASLPPTVQPWACIRCLGSPWTAPRHPSAHCWVGGGMACCGRLGMGTRLRACWQLRLCPTSCGSSGTGTAGAQHTGSPCPAPGPTCPRRGARVAAL